MRALPPELRRYCEIAGELEAALLFIGLGDDYSK